MTPKGALTSVFLFWTFQRKLRGRSDTPQAVLWRLLKKTVLWLVIVGAVELASEDVPPWIPLAVGTVLVGGALVWRARLASPIEPVGMRCSRCGATYPWGTPFFTDLAANPRNLTLSEVPRPLGVSPFERGAMVDVEPTPGSPS